MSDTVAVAVGTMSDTVAVVWYSLVVVGLITFSVWVTATNRRH